MRPKKSLTAVASMLVAIVGLSGCSAQSNVSGDTIELTVVGYSGVFKETFMEVVAEPYMAANPNVKVKFRESKGSADNLAILRVEKGKPTNDIVIMDTNWSSIGNTEGLFAPLDRSVVTNLEDIDPLGTTTGDFGPAYTFDSLMLMFNKEAVSKEPTEWEDLLDPAYKGNVVINEGMGVFFALTLNESEGADYKQTLQPGLDWIKKLAPSVQTWAAQPDPYSLVANGTADIGVGYNARAQLYADQTNGAIGINAASAGSVLQMNTISLVAGSAHPVEAQELLNYAISPEGQAALANKMYYAPTNMKTQLSDEVRNRVATGILSDSQVVTVDWDFVAPKVDEWQEAVHRIAVGN